MTFTKYASDGGILIQPAALILSNLDREDTLEMHTLEKALVLFKKDMTPLEKGETACGLLRLVNSLFADLLSDFDDEDDEDNKGELDAREDAIYIPIEALEDAGIWGKGLHIQSVDGAVIITADQESDDD